MGEKNQFTCLRPVCCTELRSVDRWKACIGEELLLGSEPLMHTCPRAHAKSALPTSQHHLQNWITSASVLLRDSSSCNVFLPCLLCCSLVKQRQTSSANLMMFSESALKSGTAFGSLVCTQSLVQALIVSLSSALDSPTPSYLLLLVAVSSYKAPFLSAAFSLKK